MKAMILAAGRGSRLRPLTDTVPKPMIPIAGLPLLEHTLRLLRSHGFDDLIINLHHLPEVIRQYFGNGDRLGVRLRYADEPQLRGTAGAIRDVATSGFFGDEEFLVFYGDNLINADLTALWQSHLSTQAQATIGLVWMPDPHDRGIVGLAADGRIDRLVEKPSTKQLFDDYLINAGVYAIGPDVVDSIPATGTPDFAVDVFPHLLQRGDHLVGHRLMGQLLSTDTAERYQAACEQVAAGHFALP